MLLERGKVNFLSAFLVLIACLFGVHGQKKGPQIYLYDGKRLTELHYIMLPNLGKETIQFVIGSSYELQSASVDSKKIGLCQLQKSFLKQTSIKADGTTRGTRWYAVKWESNLKVGSRLHTILLTARSGKIYKQDFTIDVEGNRKQDKLNGENR